MAWDFLMHGGPDVIVNVVDVSTLRRSLNFTFQIMEMGLPVVLGCNMMDVARQNGIEVDIAGLEAQLGVRVVPLIGRKGVGKKELQSAVLATVGQHGKGALQVNYNELEPEIEALRQQLRDRKSVV